MKRYLKTPEEVIDALQEGKTLTNGRDVWKMYKGLFVRYGKNYGWSVSDGIASCYDVYIEEPEPLKLEVGKFYKTRDGRKAIVLNVVKDDTRSCPVRVVVVDNTYEPYFVRKSGRLYKNEENAWDIVAPWEE